MEYMFVRQTLRARAMALSLPDAVSTYFAISNGVDIASIHRVFTHDALVVDEGRSYRGPEAIESWQREARGKFEYTVDPVSTSREGDLLRVTAEVVGDFPGSPVKLDHVFGMAGDRITSLEIG